MTELKPAFQIYIVRRNSDLTEGKGGMIDVMAFSDLGVAEVFVRDERKRSGGNWTCDIKTVDVFNKAPSHDDLIRAKALRKLTDEERKVLGL
jgi:hypothetical protein